MKLYSRLAATALVACSLGAKAELANAIRAIVNDAVITYQEVESLNQQTEDLLIRQYRNTPSALDKKLTEMRNENLDRLVERQLILHEFKTAGYSLPESVLEDLVQESIKSDFGDRATLTKTLEARGISYEKFRQQIKERFIVAQLRLKNVSAEIIISPHKIEVYYQAHRDDYKEEDRVKLRRITLTKTTGTNGPNMLKMAEEIVQKIKEGASFAQMAAIHSQGSQESREGVWYDRSALRRELAEVAFSLKPGECSSVIETGGECYILMVDEVSTSHYKTLAEVRDEVEKKLLSDERNRIEKQWIDRLRKKTFVQYLLVDSPLRIGISLGDITGIGPEVTLKALAQEWSRDDTRYVLLGDPGAAGALSRNLGLNLQLAAHQESPGSERLTVFDPSGYPLPSELQAGSPEAARAAVACVREGAQRCLRGELDALVTAPVNKEAIVRAGIDFIGQTELLSDLAGTDRTAMMLLGTDDRGRWLRVALATTHLPLRAVADSLTARKIEVAIDLSAQSCRELRLARARIGVCGLNPHAGEGGKIGTEELTLIGPAVKAAQGRGIDVVGPVSADALFYYAYRGDYDVVVAMYHDQGLAPLKTVAFEQGVNWTIGLPFIRTSPDHGTAYDIAGRGVANPSSMVAALRLAKQLAASRKR